MYAVMISGGKQYRVKEGQLLKLEKLPTEVGESVEFDKVLLLKEGEKTTVGLPYVAGSKVTATVERHGRHDKIKIIKMKRRKHHMKHMGHRQHFTEVRITAISA